MLADRAAQPYSPFWHFLRLTPVTARVRYRANKSTLGDSPKLPPECATARINRPWVSPWQSHRSHNPARLRPLGMRALEPSQSLCFRSFIITRYLIPRNRGAVCPLVPRLGMPLKLARITRNSKGLNQIGSVAPHPPSAILPVNCLP